MKNEHMKKYYLSFDTLYYIIIKEREKIINLSNF